MLSLSAIKSNIFTYKSDASYINIDEKCAYLTDMHTDGEKIRKFAAGEERINMSLDTIMHIVNLLVGSAEEEFDFTELSITAGTASWSYASKQEDDEETLESFRTPLLILRANAAYDGDKAAYCISVGDKGFEINHAFDEAMRSRFGISVYPPIEKVAADTEKYLRTVKENIDRCNGKVSEAERVGINTDGIYIAALNFREEYIYRAVPAADKITSMPGYMSLEMLFGDKAVRSSSGRADDDIQSDKLVRPDQLCYTTNHGSRHMLALSDSTRAGFLRLDATEDPTYMDALINIASQAVAQDHKLLFVVKDICARQALFECIERQNMSNLILPLCGSTDIDNFTIIEKMRESIEGHNGLDTEKFRSFSDLYGKYNDLRVFLNKYYAAMNQPVKESGLTPYDIFGKMLMLAEEFQQAGEEVQPILLKESEEWSKKEYSQKRKYVSELQKYLSDLGMPRENPFWGSTSESAGEEFTEQVKAEAAQALEMFEKMSAAADEIADMLGLPHAINIKKSERHAELAEYLASRPDVSGINISSELWNSTQEIWQKLDEGEELSGEHKKLRQIYANILNDSAYAKTEAELREMKEVFEEYLDKFGAVLHKRFRTAVSEMEEMMQAPGAKRQISERIKVLDTLIEMKRAEAYANSEFDVIRELCGENYRGINEDWRRLARLAEWYDAIDRLKLSTEEETLYGIRAGEYDIEAIGEKNAAFKSGTDRFYNSVKDFMNTVRLKGNDIFMTYRYTDMREQLKTWRDSAGRLNDISRYNELVAQMEREGIRSVAALAQKWRGASKHLTEMFEYNYLGTLCTYAAQERESIGRFDIGMFEAKRQEFISEDREIEKTNHERMQQAYYERILSIKRDPELKRESEGIAALCSGAAYAAPGENLLETYSRIIRFLRPIFIANPGAMVSVPNRIGAAFDTAIFVDGDDVGLYEALGAILRSKQLIVAKRGDSRKTRQPSLYAHFGEKRVYARKLKEFLPAKPVAEQKNDIASDFDEYVIRYVRHLGYEADRAVDCDEPVSIIVKNSAGAEIMYIITDGQGTEKCHSASERERMYDEHFKGAAAAIYRVYSLAWYKNASEEAEKLKIALKKCE